jgi:hypothetical protein
MLAELTNRLAIIGHEVIILMPNHGIVEYDMKCKVLYSSFSQLSEDDFPYSDVIISNYYTTVPVAQRASEQGKGLHIRLALCYEPTFLPDNNQSFSSYNIARNLFVLSRWQQEIVRINHGIKGRIVPIGVNPDFYNTHRRNARQAGSLCNYAQAGRGILRPPGTGLSAAAAQSGQGASSGD